MRLIGAEHDDTLLSCYEALALPSFQADAPSNCVMGGLPHGETHRDQSCQAKRDSIASMRNTLQTQAAAVSPTCIINDHRSSRMSRICWVGDLGGRAQKASSGGLAHLSIFQLQNCRGLTRL